MMIVCRIALVGMLVSGSVIVSMEESGERRLEHIDSVLVAVIKNDIEFIQAYIDDGGDINAKGRIDNDLDLRGFIAPHLQEMIPLHLRKMTPLMTTAVYSRPKAMKILLEHGVELDATNENGDTATHMAARTMYTSLVRLLVKAGADKDIQNKQGKTALDEAYSSPLRSMYSEWKGKYGKNHSFKEMIRLLTNEVKFETTVSVRTQINYTIAKIDDTKTMTPSKQFSKNSYKSTQNTNTYHRLPNNNYISNGTVYYSPYPVQMMYSGYYPTQLSHDGYYPVQPLHTGYYPQAMHNEYYSMQMNNTQHYPRQVKHNMHYADAYPTTSERTMQNYVGLLGWSR
jgi:hypothetical protein